MMRSTLRFSRARWLTSAFLLLLALWQLALSASSGVRAHNPAVPTLAEYGSASVDGILQSGEFHSCIGSTVQNGYTFNFCEKNDQSNDYYLFQINDPIPLGAHLTILFDNLHDGIIAQCSSLRREDLLTIDSLGGFQDGNYCFNPSGPSLALATDPVQNGAGASSFTPGPGYVYEMSHPLNSGDPLDYALMIGSTVGWCLRYYDGQSISVEYPVNCWVAAQLSGTASLYGDIVKVGSGPVTTLTNPPYTRTTITTWDTELQTTSVTSTFVVVGQSTFTGYTTETLTSTSYQPITTYTLTQSTASSTITCVTGTATTLCKTETTTLITQATLTEAYQHVTQITTTLPTTTATISSGGTVATTAVSTVSSHLTTTTSTVPEFSQNLFIVLCSLIFALLLITPRRRQLPAN